MSKAAEKNHLESQYELGNYYLISVPDKPKYDKALRWFKEAAARDHVKSLYKLGKMTYEGKGLDANPSEALRLLNLAADNGLLEATHYINQIEVRNPEHMALINDHASETEINQTLPGSTLPDAIHKDSAEYYRLGIQYLTGDKGEKQFEKSAFYFQKAAQQNHAKAQYQLAKLYKQGIGVEQSEQLYREWLQKAADAGVQSAVREWDTLQVQGDSQTQSPKRQEPNDLYILGLKYLTGNEVPKDPVKAYQLFLDAALQEHPRSQYQLGIMYIDGIGLSRDKDKGKQWLTKAADAGLVDAQFVLNSLTPQQPTATTAVPITVIPDPANESEEKPLFDSTTSQNASLIRRAENGDPDTQYELGMNYLKGKDGFEKDTEQALFWLEKAAENGIADSQYQLGKLYKSGLGVDKNNRMAIMWFRKAANQGHKEARKRLGGCRIC